MTIYKQHQNYLDHAVWLKSNNVNIDNDFYILDLLMSRIEFLSNRSIDMSTVEKIIYHYIMNDFSRTPYKNFDCNMYQNAYPEHDDDIEEIKIMICKVCGYANTFFNENVQEKYSDLNLKFSWAN